MPQIQMKSLINFTSISKIEESILKEKMPQTTMFGSLIMKIIL